MRASTLLLMSMFLKLPRRIHTSLYVHHSYGYLLNLSFWPAINDAEWECCNTRNGKHCIAYGSRIYGIGQLLYTEAPRQNGAEIGVESARTAGKIDNQYCSRSWHLDVDSWCCNSCQARRVAEWQGCGYHRDTSLRLQVSIIFNLKDSAYLFYCQYVLSGMESGTDTFDYKSWARNIPLYKKTLTMPSPAPLQMSSQASQS